MKPAVHPPVFQSPSLSYGRFDATGPVVPGGIRVA